MEIDNSRINSKQNKLNNAVTEKNRRRTSSLPYMEEICGFKVSFKYSLEKIFVVITLLTASGCHIFRINSESCFCV